VTRVTTLIIAAVVALWIGGGAGAGWDGVAAQGRATGTIEGHVRLTGPAPANPIIRMGADPMCGRMNARKRQDQQIVVRAADGGLANVFVDLQGTFPATPVSSEQVKIDQRGCIYTPRVVGARVGQTLVITNSDSVLHNLHSISSKGNDFNVSQPQAGMVFNVTLKNEETMLRVKCDVHGWMTSYVGVVTHPYFAVSATTGSFTIANVPAGKQTIRAWHELYGRLMQSVDVKPGATTTVEFEYTGAEKPAAAQIRDLIIPAA
jgi:plastocyanin